MLTWDFIKQKNFRLNDTDLHPTVAQRGWEVVFEAWQQSIYVLITQAHRSIAEQDALYEQGRTKPGKKVTNAKGGESYHNFGLALDFALYTKDGKEVIWDDSCAEWKKVVQLFKSKGFEWGGDFRTFKDTPHVQLTFGFTLSQLRAGKRPARSTTVVTVPEPAKAVATIENKGEIEMTKEQANAAIKLLQQAYQNAKTDDEKKMIGLIADSYRVASGQKAVNG